MVRRFSDQVFENENIYFDKDVLQISVYTFWRGKINDNVYSDRILFIYTIGDVDIRYTFVLWRDSVAEFHNTRPPYNYLLSLLSSKGNWFRSMPWLVFGSTRGVNSNGWLRSKVWPSRWRAGGGWIDEDGRWYCWIRLNALAPCSSSGDSSVSGTILSQYSYGVCALVWTTGKTSKSVNNETIFFLRTVKYKYKGQRDKSRVLFY